MSRQIVRPAGRLAGRIMVPGDKSISHRALILTGIGQGSCRLRGLSTAMDVEATRGALASLGIVIRDPNGQVKSSTSSTQALDREILVEGLGRDNLSSPDSAID